MCLFCSDTLDYYPLEPMNIPLLLRYMNSSGFIKSRKQTGLCKKMQSRIATTINQARNLGLFTYKGSGFQVNNPLVEHDIPLYPKEEIYFRSFESELDEREDTRKISEMQSTEFDQNT